MERNLYCVPTLAGGQGAFGTKRACVSSSAFREGRPSCVMLLLRTPLTGPQRERVKAAARESAILTKRAVLSASEGGFGVVESHVDPAWEFWLCSLAPGQYDCGISRKGPGWIYCVCIPSWVEPEGVVYYLSTLVDAVEEICPSPLGFAAGEKSLWTLGFRGLHGRWYSGAEWENRLWDC